MAEAELDWISVGHVEDLPEGRVKTVTARTTSICLVHFDGPGATRHGIFKPRFIADLVDRQMMGALDPAGLANAKLTVGVIAPALHATAFEEHTRLAAPGMDFKHGRLDAVDLTAVARKVVAVVALFTRLDDVVSALRLDAAFRQHVESGVQPIGL